MKKKQLIPLILAGLSAGIINGTFGAGGGMVLVPLLTMLAKLDDDAIFPCSVSMILPICLVSVTYNLAQTDFNWSVALPYLLGSAAGGILAGLLGRKIPTKWLHRTLGILILWGGIRYLC